MAPSAECVAVSSLLCTEDDGVFDDSDNYEATSSLKNNRIYDHVRTIHAGGDDDTPPFGTEGLIYLLSKESEHLPKENYLKRLRNGDLDLVARVEVIDWIRKAHAYFGFGPLSAFLSINYFDRFMSFYELPKGKAWMMQLLGVACLSLAAKMDETEIPRPIDLQVGESKFVFEAKTIQRMELLVLSTLKWRMRAVTPLSFLEYFHSKVNADQSRLRFLTLRSIELISSTLNGMDFLEFKPSEIAAAAVLIHNGQDSAEAVSALSQYVSKERLLKCKEMAQEIGYNGFLTIPQSPNGVLEAACLSFSSDDSSSSIVDILSDCPAVKRRRLS